MKSGGVHTTLLTASLTSSELNTLRNSILSILQQMPCMALESWNPERRLNMDKRSKSVNEVIELIRKRYPTRIES